MNLVAFFGAFAGTVVGAWLLGSGCDGQALSGAANDDGMPGASSGGPVQALAATSGGVISDPVTYVRPELPASTDTILPAETADAEALADMSDWSRLPVLGHGRYQQQSSHDRELPEHRDDVVDPTLTHGNRDLNNFLCKSADAQLGTTHNPPLIFDADGCAEDYVHGAVIARYEGSGALRRFWLTSSALNFGTGLRRELLRVYVDDDPRPLIQVPLAQVLDGSAGEIFAPPFGAGSSAAIAWYYPVVFGRKLVMSLDQLQSDYYFQTDVVLDDEPRARAAAPQRLPERDLVRQQLTAASPVSPDAKSLHRGALHLADRAPVAVALNGPATIAELRLRAPRSGLKNLAGVRVSVRWDDAAEPAIDLPLLELFAAGRSVIEKSDLALAASTQGTDQVLSLRLPMPFARHALWQLEQTAQGTADFELEWIGEARVPDAPYGLLRVQRDQLPLPAAALEQVYADVLGRGRYVGLCADLAGHPDSTVLSAPLHLLEGDVRAHVDDRLALDGTGTEDYADNAFYFLDSPSATPFAQSWNVVDDFFAQPSGQASFCRWQVLGSALDFQSSFKGTFEIAQYNTSIVELHRTVAFFYVAP